MNPVQQPIQLPNTRQVAGQLAVSTKMIPRQIAREDTMLSVSEVAEILRVSTKTVRRAIKQQTLNYHRFRGAIRISHQDLRSYVDSVRS